MPRAKKSRNPSLIGTPKSGNTGNKVNNSRHSDSAGIAKKKKRNKGRASGSRNSLVEQNQMKVIGSKTSKDNRLGSKKKISLIDPSTVHGKLNKEEQQNRLIPKFKTPLQELNFIENDKKLQVLLDKLDNQSSISDEEQRYVDLLLNRHKVLCDLLGMDNEEQDEGSESDDASRGSEDLLDQLDQDFRF